MYLIYITVYIHVYLLYKKQQAITITTQALCTLNVSNCSLCCTTWCTRNTEYTEKHNLSEIDVII